MSTSNVTRRGVVSGVAAGIGVATAAAGGGVGTARAENARKTFVLVHGTFCGGWVWRRVVDLLESKGHKVFVPTLTGLGERSHLLRTDINLDTHVADIVNLIKWESLEDVCLVAHSYAGWVVPGVLEEIGSRVSSAVWLDAYKPQGGQRPMDLTREAFRKALLVAAEKGEAGFPPPNLGPIFVNAKDAAFVESKLTPHPIGTYLRPVTVSGAMEKVAKKTYIRIPKFPNPPFDKALAECKADATWATLELGDTGHMAMFDAPDRLTDLLLNAA